MKLLTNQSIDKCHTPYPSIYRLRLSLSPTGRVLVHRKPSASKAITRTKQYQPPPLQPQQQQRRQGQGQQKQHQKQQQIWVEMGTGERGGEGVAAGKEREVGVINACPLSEAAAGGGRGKDNKSSSGSVSIGKSWVDQDPYEWGWCKYSRQHKAPRAHYDHVTQKVVLNMDHCKFINDWVATEGRIIRLIKWSHFFLTVY
jgi:hypothetical protein